MVVNKFRRIIFHYFFPHESNNYKARTLHISALLYYVVLLFLFQTLTGIVRHIQPNILGYATDISAGKVLYLINQERTKNNLPLLSLSPELSTAATVKAADMFDKNYWAHISPTGTTPWVFITSAGYNYVYAGENLAKDFDTSENVVKAWMNSATHRANILKQEYKDIGLAVMNGKLQGEETTLVVQEFGARPVQNKDLAKTGTSATVSIVPSMAPIASVQKQNIPDQTTTKFLLPGSITKQLSLALAEFLLIVLLVDSVYIWRYKTLRLSGHSLAHIIFLGALIGAMGATGIGVIL